VFLSCHPAGADTGSSHGGASSDQEGSAAGDAAAMPPAAAVGGAVVANHTSDEMVMEVAGYSGSALAAARQVGPVIDPQSYAICLDAVLPDNMCCLRLRPLAALMQTSDSRLPGCCHPQEEQEVVQQLHMLVRRKGVAAAVVGSDRSSSSEEAKWQQVLLAPSRRGHAARGLPLRRAALLAQPRLLQWIMLDRLRAKVQAE
jgi:hypothetical protein